MSLLEAPRPLPSRQQPVWRHAGVTGTSSTGRIPSDFPLDVPERTPISDSATAAAVDTEQAAGSVRRSELMNDVYQRLQRYALIGSAATNVVENAAAAISFLVEDDSATAQIGLDGEGGLETEWLVDGRALILNNYADGTNLIWALDADGSIPFRKTFTTKWMIGDEGLEASKTHLREISRAALNRLRNNNAR